MNKKVFIGGPISCLISESGFVKEFMQIHKMVIQILQQADFQILSAHVVEDYGKKKLEPDEVIVERDLAWIDEADLCVFLLPTRSNEAVRTDGSYIEIGYASSKCKRIICFWDSKKPDLYSPMFRGMTIKNVKTYDISMIKEVNNIIIKEVFVMRKELLEGLTEEQIKKVENCKSPEEILALAKEEGVTLSDEQLAAVSGGACIECIIKCPNCSSGNWDDEYKEINHIKYRKFKCNDCGHKWKEELH